MGSATAGVGIPEGQAPLSDYRAIELKPGLELEDSIHEQTVQRLVVAPWFASKTRLHLQHIGWTEDPSAEETFMKEPRHTGRQYDAKPGDLAARHHDARHPDSSLSHFHVS